MCKVLVESVIRNGVMEHVSKFDFIKELQHGFMKTRSCLTNLLKFLEFVTNNMESGIPNQWDILRFSKSIGYGPA